MLQLLKKKLLKIKNKNKKEICANCVWHKSEEMDNMPFKKHVSYCGINQKYTVSYDTCTIFREELYEATENSTSTPEYSLDLELDFDPKNKL